MTTKAKKPLIVIKVTSEVVECVRTFKSDRPSITFLKRIKRLHDNVAKAKAGPRPTGSRKSKVWKGWVAASVVPVKIEITHVN